MNAYFQSEHATLYVGDCREVCASLPRQSVDLLATDPPYGVKWQSGRRRERFDTITGDDGSLDVPAVLGEITRHALRRHRHVYVFGYRPEALVSPLLLGSAAELIWDKEHVGPGNLAVPWAPSFERCTFGVHVKSRGERERGDGRLAARLRSGAVLRHSRVGGSAVTRHPTEKPVPLMRMLVESSSLVGETVLDPFAGSGSTLVASVLAGRRAIGVELEERYAEIAAKRIEKAEAIVAEMATV